MTTNKPEVVAYTTHHDEPMLFHCKREAETYCDDGEEPVALIRLSDYKALQAECEKLRCIISDIKDWDCDDVQLDAAKSTAAIAWGWLWHVTTADDRVKTARHLLGQMLDKDLKRYGIQTAKAEGAQVNVQEIEAAMLKAREGEEIMVNTPYDVFILPLQPSGLSSGPRFVVHVPRPEVQPPEALAKHQPCGCVLCTCEDEKQCQGCGAKHCGNRTDHPPYVNQQPAEQHPDDAAVDRFAAAMKAKLKKKRQEGRGGWQSMTAEQLSTLLHEHVRKGDPVDVANLAMMLHQNGQTIEPPATVVTDEMVDALRAEVVLERNLKADAIHACALANIRAELLAEALEELITWIPSADTYRRLGFDPTAPMRALGEARAVLRRGDEQ